jgi:hypothetical protein
MTSSRSDAGTFASAHARIAIAGLLLLAGLADGAFGQTNDDRGGFAVREVSLSTGYGWMQLPPITLGGKLPGDVVQADLITNGTVQLDWARITRRTRYTFELFGAYSARTRYARLSAPGSNLTFDVSHVFGTRWRLGAGVANAITSWDQLIFAPTQTRRLIDAAASFDQLAGAVVRARSANPDAAQAALFVPIDQTLAASDLYADRSMASSVRAEAIYRHSVRLATALRGVYTTVRQITSSDRAPQTPTPQDSTAVRAGVEVRYDSSERTKLSATLDWSQVSGDSADRVVVGTVGYAWSWRKWLGAARVGAALPFQPAVTAAVATSISSRPELVYSGGGGYKFGSQTLFLQYSRAAHDDYGHGGRNVVTGFEGNVQSIGGSWSWSASSRWFARSDLSLIRRPGNFSYTYAWLSTAGIGRQLRPTLQMMGEVLFDRHGSRMFEGFHLSREGARVILIWSPSRRRVE